MVATVALSFMAAIAGVPDLQAGVSAHAALRIEPRATVTILSGAKVPLSNEATALGYKLTKATVTAEDGSRRPAKLVEFQ